MIPAGVIGTGRPHRRVLYFLVLLNHMSSHDIKKLLLKISCCPFIIILNTTLSLNFQLLDFFYHFLVLLFILPHQLIPQLQYFYLRPLARYSNLPTLLSPNSSLPHTNTPNHSSSRPIHNNPFLTHKSCHQMRPIEPPPFPPFFNAF